MMLNANQTHTIKEEETKDIEITSYKSNKNSSNTKNPLDNSDNRIVLINGPEGEVSQIDKGSIDDEVGQPPLIN